MRGKDGQNHIAYYLHKGEGAKRQARCVCWCGNWFGPVRGGIEPLKLQMAIAHDWADHMNMMEPAQ